MCERGQRGCEKGGCVREVRGVCERGGCVREVRGVVRKEGV